MSDSLERPDQDPGASGSLSGIGVDPELVAVIQGMVDQLEGQVNAIATGVMKVADRVDRIERRQNAELTQENVPSDDQERERQERLTRVRERANQERERVLLLEGALAKIESGEPLDDEESQILVESGYEPIEVAAAPVADDATVAADAVATPTDAGDLLVVEEPLDAPPVDRAPEAEPVDAEPTLKAPDDSPEEERESDTDEPSPIEAAGTSEATDDDALLAEIFPEQAGAADAPAPDAAPPAPIGIEDVESLFAIPAASADAAQETEEPTPVAEEAPAVASPAPADDPFAPSVSALEDEPVSSPDGGTANDPFAQSGGASPDSDPFAIPAADEARAGVGDTPAPADDLFALPAAKEADDPFATPAAGSEIEDPFVLPEPSASGEDPFVLPEPSASGEDPSAAPLEADDPFASPEPSADAEAPLEPPAVEVEDPFALPAVAPADDPFALPVGSQEPAAPSDTVPVSASSAVDDPFGPAPSAAGDPFAPVSNDDYRPAYADPADDFTHIIAQTDPSAGNGAVPIDLIYAIGTRDSHSDREQRQTAAVDEIRSEARQSKRKSPRDKIQANRLPFEVLTKGQPLIIAVASPKGGVGKSTTSVNIAAYCAEVGRLMAEQSGRRGAAALPEAPRVLVLDGDVANGNLAVRVARKLSPNLLDLVDWVDENGEPTVYESHSDLQSSMQEWVLWHEDLPNLNILAAPENPEAFDDFTVDDYERILNMLGRFYDVIVIDCGTEIVMNSNKTWLRYAHQVFLLTVPEVAALYSAGKYARVILKKREHGPPLVTPERLNVVMMRSDLDLGFNPERAMSKNFEGLSKDHAFYFPDFDIEAARANNRGEFLVLENGAYNQAIGQLVLAAFRNYAAHREETASVRAG